MDFIQALQHIIQQGLPGEETHLAMSPLGRVRSSEALKKATQVKKSAVAIVIYEENNTWFSVLIQRPEYEGSHSGQICLPGGKYDNCDNDLLETALRECFEETGILPKNLNLISDLTPVYIPVSNHYVQPYLFFHQGLPDFLPDEREVVELISFPLNDLLDEKKIKTMDMPLKNGKCLPNVPYFELSNKIVWGATAIILNELKTILATIEKT